MKQDMEFEFPLDINEVEMKTLMDELERFIIPMPSQDEINRTIEGLNQFVPAKKNLRRKSPKIFELLKRAFEEVKFMSMNYWLVSFGVFVLGIYVIWANNGYQIKSNDPYMMAIFLAPIPFILGIVEIFRGREEGVIELELSCKFSIGELMLSRLIIVCIYSIVLNTLMSFVLVYFNSDILLWKITLMWLTPFTLISALGLYFVSKMRGSYLVTMFTASWMIIIVSIIYQKNILDKLVAMNFAIYVLLSIIGISLLMIQIVKYGNRQYYFYERSVINEVKN